LKKPGWIAISGIAIFSGAFYILTSFLLRRWLGGTPAVASRISEEENLKSAPTPQHPPAPLDQVTIFRPIKSGEPGLRKNLTVFLSAIEAGDQVIFCASAQEELRRCEALAAGHPELDILCLQSAGNLHRNPKINKLAQMEAFASRERWIVLDSDAMPDRAFLQAFRRDWQARDVDAISAPYAHKPVGSFPSRLDGLGTGLALWPGVALLRATDRLDFLTGACMGVKASAMRKFGGWKTLGDALADDHELGRIVSRTGGRVGISNSVIELEATDLAWKEWLLHQHRAFVTFRLCNPAGSLGIPLTHGAGLSFFWLLLSPRSPGRWLLHLGLLFLRAESAKSLPGPSHTLREIWLVSLLEPFFWLFSWLPLPVFWAGKWIPPGKTWELTGSPPAVKSEPSSRV
jgi:Glycosyl transferase family 21